MQAEPPPPLPNETQHSWLAASHVEAPHAIVAAGPPLVLLPPLLLEDDEDDDVLPPLLDEDEEDVLGGEAGRPSVGAVAVAVPPLVGSVGSVDVVDGISLLTEPPHAASQIVRVGTSARFIAE